jgi:hypothetical protein
MPTYYSKKEYDHIGFEKAKAKGKMYNALLRRKSDKRIIRVPFGANNMENYQDKTGLNAYPHLIHGDKKRRASFRARHRGYLKDGYFSPGFFSYFFLW